MSGWADRRSARGVATVAMFVAVMAYSVLGHARLHGGHYELVTPSDLWSLAASAWALGHGQFGHVYVPKGALTSPPAFEVVLAPLLLAAQVSGSGASPSRSGSR